LLLLEIDLQAGSLLCGASNHIAFNWLAGLDFILPTKAPDLSYSYFNYHCFILRQQ